MATDIPVPPDVMARMKQEKLMRCYRDLFGDNPATRTEMQQLVWEDLQRAGYSKQAIFVADRAGALCPMRAAFADGRRSVLLYIEANVSFAPEIQESNNQR